ncbi:hypothetical protein BH20CHL3_BH20CHL3_03440 [soil metagenome]
MSKHKPTVDLGYPTPAYGRIPAFQNIEDEAEFWDTHSTSDFPDEWAPVEVTVSQDLAERLTLRLEKADRDALARYAKKKGLGPSTLARMWVKEHLNQEAEAEATSR